MATPRQRFRIDIYTDAAGEDHPLRRKRPGELTDVWCPHFVRAINASKAITKALTEHQAHHEACRLLAVAYQ